MTYLFGHPSNPEWQTSWRAASLYEVPLTILCADVQCLDLPDIEPWAYQAEKLPAWKENGTWVQLYTHTVPADSSITSTPTIDAAHLDELLTVLEEDGEVWIGSMNEIAAYFRRYHFPGVEEEYIWEFNEGTGVPLDHDRSHDPEYPWNGFKCAFTFSTDDGWKSNLTDFAPVFEQHGRKFTAFLNPYKILNPWIAFMTEAELSQLALSDAVDFGNHSFSHLVLIPDVFATYSGSGQIEIRSVEVDVGTVKQLNLIVNR